MKFYQLEYFVEVYKNKSISKAAENLFVSQPAVSFALKDIEDEFGVKLFKRESNKITATPPGDYFYERVTQLLESANNLKADMMHFSNNAIRIRVGTPPMIGTMLFPEIYNRIKEKLPHIKIEILEYGSLQAQNLVVSGDAEVAIAIMNQLVDDSIEAFSLFDTELVFCVNRCHPLAKKDCITWEELEEQDLILMKEDSYQNAMIKQRFAENNLKPNIMLYSSQLTTIRNFIAHSNAGAFLFKEIAEQDSELKALSLNEPVNLSIGIIWRKNSRLYSEVKSFISFIREYVAEKKKN